MPRSSSAISACDSPAAAANPRCVSPSSFLLNTIFAGTKPTVCSLIFNPSTEPSKAPGRAYIRRGIWVTVGPKPGTSKPRAREGPEITARDRRLLAKIGGCAEDYYNRSGRQFEWRGELDPFQLAIAEILLQKTRASSIVDIYHLLITRFPEARDMAVADVTELARVLSPLGLANKRAANLVRMAQFVEMHGSQTFANWKGVVGDVPGIGAYGARGYRLFLVWGPSGNCRCKCRSNIAARLEYSCTGCPCSCLSSMRGFGCSGRIQCTIRKPWSP